jgi:methyl coenzyme M reductase beta subunit
MVDAFVVEVGALCEEPGDQLGTLVEVQRTERFRISAVSPAAAETAGMQLFSAEATRQRRLVRDAWGSTCRMRPPCTEPGPDAA